MPKRGRKPKPAALRVLEGNPSGRPIAPGVEYALDWPSVPAWLDAEARAHWEVIREQLDGVGVVAHVDGGLLAGLCDCYSRAVRASKRAQLDASAESRAEKAWEGYRKFCAVFGIGPAERPRIPRGLGTPTNGSEVFFGGR
jgi:phage terminase small subunit